MIIEKQTKYGYMSYFKNDMAFADSLSQGKIYEQDLVLDVLKEHIVDSKVILDIGAHAGSHTILYKYLNPDCKIYCFEPQKKMFDLLTNNIKKNNLSDVEVFNVGIANIKTDAELGKKIQDGDNTNLDIEYGTEKKFNLGGVQIGSGGEKIKTITIDSLHLEKCDFIKIDIEGFETLAFIGGRKTIKKYKPVILFENNYKNVSRDYAKKFNVPYPTPTPFEILEEYGYKNIELIDGLWNYLAIY